MTSKTELFNLTEALFEQVVTEGMTEGQLQEEWEDAQGLAEDMLNGLVENPFV
ncbi:MAG: hypothetical protein ACTSO3_01320 [Candidatus Heimdallarchaeaceae archaeon]